MVLSDFPYGGTSNAWDKPLDLERVWAGLRRAMKPGAAAVLFARPPYDKILALSNLDNYRYEYVWIKPQGTNFLDAGRLPLKRTERILVFCDRRPPWHPDKRQGKPYKTSRRRPTPIVNQKSLPRTIHSVNDDGLRWPTDVLEFGRDKGGLHPTQKPLDLCQWLVRAYSEPGGVVLDICAGSGTTAVAAMRTGRRFVAFESDPGIFALAQARLSAEAERISSDDSDSSRG
jgi:site-specific DNA-methyltransferase (adenine-specific)